jgi:hypothetical protein
MTTALSGRGLVRANEQREYKQMLTQILLWRVFTFGRSSLNAKRREIQGIREENRVRQGRVNLAANRVPSGVPRKTSDSEGFICRRRRSPR